MSNWGFSTDTEPVRTYLHDNDNDDAPKYVFNNTKNFVPSGQHEDVRFSLSVRVASRMVRR